MTTSDKLVVFFICDCDMCSKIKKVKQSNFLKTNSKIIEKNPKKY